MNDFTGQRNLDGITVSMQVLALAFMVWDAMACIKFQACRDLHTKSWLKIRLLLYAELSAAIRQFKK